MMITSDELKRLLIDRTMNERGESKKDLSEIVENSESLKKHFEILKKIEGCESSIAYASRRLEEEAINGAVPHLSIHIEQIERLASVIAGLRNTILRFLLGLDCLQKNEIEE